MIKIIIPNPQYRLNRSYFQSFCQLLMIRCLSFKMFSTGLYLVIIFQTMEWRFLTVACQILLKEVLEALGSLQVTTVSAEVVIGDNVVLWIPHHVDNLIKKQITSPELKPIHTILPNLYNSWLNNSWLNDTLRYGLGIVIVITIVIIATHFSLALSSLMKDKCLSFCNIDRS